jgi:hypothetical protein
MSADLQRIVDGLAARIGRPALIEDRRQRVVVYSEHGGPMDEVRRRSILRRHTTSEVMAWFRVVGVHQARGPLRTPGNPDLDLLPRVCVPIWHRDLLLGHVWFIDDDGSMTDGEVSVAEDAASDLALALYRENLVGELASQRETEAVRTLLSDVPEQREHAARSLVEDGVLVEGTQTVALVGRLFLRPGCPPGDEVRIAIEHALVGTHRWLGAREAAHLVRYDHGALVVSTSAGSSRAATTDVAEHLYAGLETAVRGLPGVLDLVGGVGQARERLAEVKGSYDEAVQAARVAANLPALGRVANWSQLGIYRVLAQLPTTSLDGGGVHPGFERLLAEPASAPLVETLEAYLDLAGNAHATAARLRLHRTSLYYRLQRVEQLAATDLKDGNERLCLHLAIKLARLSGRYPGAGVAAGLGATEGGG